jgi:site-specific DNA recombinase
MSPSFSAKNGVRYRFYVSTALRGRKHNAGSVTRISAPEIESLIEATLSEKIEAPDEEMLDHVERVVVSIGRIQLELKRVKGRQGSIEIPWTPKPKGTAQIHPATPDESIDQKLLKSIVRAHAWLDDLASDRHASVEDLGAAAKLHPKVIRQGLRLAFLEPRVTVMALDSSPLVRLKQIPKLLPLSWREQRQLLR